MRLYAGQQLGQYVLDYSLGAGGMAAVWAATHRILGVQVAVKVLFSGNPVLQDRLLREGRAQAAMVHPNILPVRDVIDVAGHLGLVLPLVRGPSLDKLLQAYRPTLAEAVGVFREIVEGVRYAHERGLIHRDLKPGNVLLEEQRSQIVPLVADFGLVKGTAEPGMTQTHAVMGTLRYAAPEQLLDASSVDLRADLFSLGVLFVELLTGTPPFQGSSLQALLDAYQQAPELRGVPAPFAPLCRHLLAHAADQRPSDCGEVLERLNAVHPQPAVAVLGLASGLARAMRARPVADAVVPDTNASQTRDLSGTFSESLFEAFGTAETAPPKNNLPAALDTFIGRETELAQLTEQLANSRLITVTGAGGIGKTRFVLQFSHQNRSSFPGGVFFCDLSEARDLEGIVFVVSQAMDIPLGRGDHLKQLGHAIAAHGRCLLVLDNFEQIAAFAPGTVERWLKEAPEARFVVTSRVLLEVSGEQTCRLQPLTEDAAVWMFVHRAQNKKRTFRLTDGNRDAVLQLVRQLDCLPLAIELACARIGIMTPEVMVKRMSRRFQLLASGKRNTAHRQATLRAAIDWSWALLEDWEKDAFAQCSVFEGGFTLEAAEAIIALDDDAPWPMDAIQSL
ncbi:MAG: protein kinase, partial [Myxococcota bacterium]